MAFRKRMGKKKSRRMFSKTARRVNKKNTQYTMRGGRRM